MTPAADLEAVTARLRAAGCVFAEAEAALLVDTVDPAELDAAVERRCAGLPLEHLLGWAEFAGRRVAVGPGVFVPRRRTELLVDLALPRLAPGMVVVELCCGCAAVAAALAAACPHLELYALELDPVAAGYAGRNLAGHSAKVLVGDLDTPLPAELAGRVDVLVANAPYVPTAELELMPRDAREHEPRASLDGGVDGLDLYRRVAALASHWLRPGGLLLLETSDRQAQRSLALVERHGLTARLVTDADRGATAVVGTTPARRL